MSEDVAADEGETMSPPMKAKLKLIVLATIVRLGEGML